MGVDLVRGGGGGIESGEMGANEPLLLGQTTSSSQQQRQRNINDTTNKQTTKVGTGGGRHRRRSTTTGSGGEKDELMVELDRVLSRQFGPLVYTLGKTIESGEKRQRERRLTEIAQDEWSDVAMISDHILCYFFCLLTLASCFLIFFNSPHVLAEW